MGLIKWDPKWDLSKFFDEDFFSPISMQQGWGMATDIYEEKGKLIVKTQIPGFDAKDLDITVEDNYLKISGKQKNEREEKKKNYYMKQIKSGVIAKTIMLPKDVLGDKANANLEKGVLVVSIPLKEGKKKKSNKIQIKEKK